MYGITTAPITVEGIAVPAGTAVRIIRHNPMGARGHKVRFTLPGVAGYLTAWTTRVDAA